ncbi:glutathione S-transferase C-terminal domain-containing protein (plasmid) [Brevundimonas staleyi]
MGNRFTVADAYLFTVLGWMKGFGIDLSRWPKIAAYMRRIEVRPSVAAALEREAAVPSVA